ncbi:hypothetical protein GGI15_004825 [Coemansia interrupta]|uniref:Zinc-finger domain-containing protein n=1 Tax=Coemansia interrupta TaxID=1126814 RepID=A0A9W8H4J5_9FUNG|nr:hypothetical protein GGI15_004825 [Coemansia interrupta]
MSTYEDERQQQMRENEAFLASLGIETAKIPKRPVVKRVLKKSQDNEDFKPTMEYNIRRRSDRISYSENNYDRYGTYARKKPKSSAGMGIRTSNPGRRIVGGRVYDSQHGSSCHQCRQKTMDPKMHCSNEYCNIMFDENCLEIRYGEVASEIRDNGEEDSWTCPKCRDICNCSNCRRKKNMAPTGQLSIFVKAHGEAVASSLLSGKGASDTSYRPALRKPRARTRRNTFAGVDLMIDDSEDEGPKKYPTRNTREATRKRIAYSLGLENEDDEWLQADRKWMGWESVPSNFNCVVLIE